METKMDPVLADIKKINKQHNSFLVYHYLVKALSYSIDKYATGKVLDVGCGYKPYRSLFKDNITEYIGCDINQTQLNSVDIICDVQQIPLPDESFDTVFCTQVIEHVYDHKSLLKETHRLLKNGGVIILSGPLYWPVHGEPHDFFRFTKYGFVKLLEECGYSVNEIKENGGAWATAGQSLVHSFEFSTNKSFFFKAIRFLFFRMGIKWLYNTIFLWLDRKDKNPVNTLNYVIVASKKD